jgi:hypothetical protein
VTAFNHDSERLAELHAKYPSMEFVVPEGREQAVTAVADADAVFGQLTPDEFAAQTRLKWVQSGSAGVEWMWRVPVSPTRTSSSPTCAARTPSRSPSTPLPCC